MSRDCPSICQNASNFGDCMGACQGGAPCSNICRANEWDRETCLSDCRRGSLSAAMRNSKKVRRTRADIPMGVKVTHHAYFIPLAIGIVLAIVAYKGLSSSQ